MTEQAPEPNEQPDLSDNLMFFWAKWAHHDNLMNSRLNRFLTLQGIVLSLSIFVLNTQPTEFIRYIIFCIAIPFVGLIGLQTLNTIRADFLNRCRFDAQIIAILESKGLDVVTDVQKPHNWHTPQTREYKKISSNFHTPRILRYVSLLQICSPVVFLIFEHAPSFAFV